MKTVYVYMDESGDLGFDFSKSKTSNHFVITLLFTDKPGSVEKIVQKIFRGFSQLEIKNHHGVLHAYKEKPITRQRVLKYLAGKDVKILTIRLNKQNVYAKLKDEKHILYNYVVNILLDRMFSKKIVKPSDKVIFVASKRETNKFLNENFSMYINRSMKTKHDISLEIQIKTPAEDKCLQVVDICSWSFFRKYEHKDSTYYSIYKNLVIEENSLFK